MNLSFNDLKKRDVVNINDGKCLGQVVDIVLSFPKGELIGIVAPGKKTCKIFRIFSKNDIYIDRTKIQKIGTDVILVNLKCGDMCTPNTNVITKNNNCSFPCSPCDNNMENGGIDISDY